MAAGKVDISEIEFIITLDDLKNFDSFKSNIFHVCGNPWMIAVHKIGETLWLSLISKIEDEPENWTIVTSGSAILIPSNDLIEPIKRHFSPGVFYHGNRLQKALVYPWALMDPEHGFVTNDTCQLKIKVKSTPLLVPLQHDWLKIESIQNCYDNNLDKKFRMTVKLYDDFIGICSPELAVNNSKCRISITKISIKKMIRIELREIMESDFQLEQRTMTCSLISFNPQKKLLQKPINTRAPLDLITWDELIKPLNHYIQNNSIVLEITFKGKATKRRACDVDDDDMCVCTICYEKLKDLAVSSLLCGHIFCTPCIKRSIQQRKKCPTCNRYTNARQIRKVFLPI